MKKLLLPLGILVLFFLGARGIALETIGRQHYAVVTGYEQVINNSTEAADHIYKVSYAFSTEKGSRYTGSFRKKAFKVTNLPSKGQKVSIRYLSFAPGLNGKKGENLKMGLICLGLGVLLLIFALTRKRGNTTATRACNTKG